MSAWRAWLAAFAFLVGLAPLNEPRASESALKSDDPCATQEELEFGPVTGSLRDAYERKVADSRRVLGLADCKKEAGAEPDEVREGYERSAELALEATRINPERGDAFLLRSVVLEKLGRASEAKKLRAQGLKLTRQAKRLERSPAREKK